MENTGLDLLHLEMIHQQAHLPILRAHLLQQKLGLPLLDRQQSLMCHQVVVPQSRIIHPVKMTTAPIRIHIRRRAEARERSITYGTFSLFAFSLVSVTISTSGDQINLVSHRTAAVETMRVARVRCTARLTVG